jgi:hypothetical protein
MINALSADAPEPALTASLHLFGQFVGSWDLEWHGKDRQGNSSTAAGELHVGWILGGRALQDVWRVPLNPADASRMRAFHGTTIRFYDPSIEAWRSTWLDPLNGRVRRFIGRPVGVTLLLTGLEDDPLERWIFSDITQHNFHWTGQSSTDAGLSWVTEDEMDARRRQT